MKKIYVMFIILFVLNLAACEASNNSDSSTNTINLTNQKNEANTYSNKQPLTDNTEENTDSQEKDENTESNTLGNNNMDQQPNLVKEYRYETEEEAINAIKDYYKVEQTNLDLGHNIKGFNEGAAGHQYISWNEGKWLIEVNFPTDSVYAIDDYENAEALAKAIVVYLEDHFLPPPDERGKIQINGFREHPETIIQWQEGNKVYVIQQKTANPLETLQIAVEHAKKK